MSMLELRFSATVINALFFLLCGFAGIRAVHAHRYTGHVAGCIRNWARVYVCDAQTAADDHIRGGQAIDTDVLEFAGSAVGRIDRRSTNVSDWI